MADKRNSGNLAMDSVHCFCHINLSADIYPKKLLLLLSLPVWRFAGSGREMLPAEIKVQKSAGRA